MPMSNTIEPLAMRQRIDRMGRGIGLSYKLIAETSRIVRSRSGWLRILLDLLADPAHMDINRAYIANESIIPELLEQLLTG